MSDSDERPQPRRFEPPPWEREQFEELARKRAEVEAARAAEDAARAEAEAAQRTRLEAQAAARASAAAAAPAPAGGTPPAGPVAGPGQDDRLDQRRVQAMLVQLSGEGEHALAPVRRASRVFAIAAASLGAAVVVYAVITGVRAGGGAGATGAAVVGFVGAFTAGFAGWLWVRTDREKGADI